MLADAARAGMHSSTAALAQLPSCCSPNLRGRACEAPHHGRDADKTLYALRTFQCDVRTCVRARACAVVQAKLQLHRFGDGSVAREVELPGVGSIGGFSGSHKHSDMFFTFTGFTEPGATFR